MFDLAGKVVIITGGARGIGRGIAETFARHGANTVIADLNLGEAEDLAAMITSETGNLSLGLRLNVESEEMIKYVVERAMITFGQIDILVNNAGIQTISPVEEFELESWNKMINVHLTGSFLISKYCMQQMIKSASSGKIITIGSVHSVCASENKSAYVSAKHAQLGLTRSLAVEGGKHNITANLIAPGYVWTDLVRQQIPLRAAAENLSESEVKASMLKDTVDGEFSTIDDIANTALFFATFSGNALTGQSLIVSHGWNMQ
ncbi:3-hydroxybutyrate dehydrogenase [Dongshaea marina]|uniref:3-hydroxybutyrate dehydrogenase n=1 Tax=Dongshaea marina TaxID=2047966 RepID=UPI000D3E7451|nr:3-hydroxybutyrate dehydrogenase [Dongshaea marina]